MSVRKKETLVSGLWWLFFCLTSTLWCVAAAHALGATFDEPLYFKLGLEHWNNGLIKPLMRYGSMPLSIDWQTLPLHLLEKWRGIPLDPVNDLAWGLPVARAGTLLFWWLLLGYGFCIGKMLGGHRGGRLAVALLAWEPNLLAHASLATADIPVAACLLALFYEFRKNRGAGWKRRVLLPGILYGLAMLAKASALVFGPILLIVIECERLAHAGKLRDRDSWIRFLRELRTAALIGLGTVLFYCGCDWNTEPTFIQWAQTLRPGILHDALLWISRHLAIFSNGAEGLIQQIKHNIRGHDVFILGREYRRAVWYYFPVALSIKCTLPLLFLPLWIAISRWRALLNPACLAAGALLVYSLNCRVQIGIRLMLPLIALACVGLGAAAAHARQKNMLALLALAGVAWSGVSTARVWPEALCYVNELWGGPDNGCRLLSDSNGDWGQGLNELRAWAEPRRIAPLDVWYFGTDPSVRVLPLRELQLHRLEGVPGVADAVRGRCVAVSATLLYGCYAKSSPAGVAARDFFKNQTPTGRTPTFFIYDFRR